MEVHSCCNDTKKEDNVFIYENNRDINNFILANTVKGGYVESEPVALLEGGELSKEKADSIISKMKKELSSDEIEDPSMIMEYLKYNEPTLSKFDRMLIRYIVLKAKNEKTVFVNDFLKSSTIRDEIRRLGLDTDLETRRLVKVQAEQWNGNLTTGQVMVNKGNMSIESLVRTLGFGTKYSTLFVILQAMFLPKIDIFDMLYLESDLIDIVNKRYNDKDISDISRGDSLVLDNLIRNDITIKSEVKRPFLYIIRVLSIVKKIVYNIRSTKSVFPSEDIKVLLEALDVELDMIDITPTSSYAVNAYTRLSRVVGLYPVIAIVEKKKGKSVIESYNIIKYNSDYLNNLTKHSRKDLIERYFKDETSIKNQRENIFRDITEKDLFLSYIGKSSIKDVIKVEGVLPSYVIRQSSDNNLNLCSLNYSCSDNDSPTIIRTINTSEQTSQLVSAVCYEEQVDFTSGSAIYNDLSVFPLIYAGSNRWLNFSKKTIYNKLSETDTEIKNLASSMVSTNEPNTSGIARLLGLFVQKGIDVKEIGEFLITESEAMDIINNRCLMLFYKDNNFSSPTNMGVSCIF